MNGLIYLLPEIISVFFLLVLVFRELLQKKDSANTQGMWTLSFIAIVVTFVSVLAFAGHSGNAFGESFTLDPFAIFFKAFFVLTAGVVLFMSRTFFQKRAEHPAEFVLILWCSLIGLFFLASANNFLLMFVALETFTLSLYILAAYLKKELSSIEAGVKYLIMGSLASAFVIYGISLIYIATGSLDFPAVKLFFNENPDDKLMLLGILFIFSGLGFKVASAPFQLWVPDVYEGAPTPVVAYFSVASKAAGFVLLSRLFMTVFPAFEEGRILLLSVLAAITLIYGNLGAIAQTNIKRLFGYSSISHAGYLLIGVAVGQETGMTALFYYLIAYAISNLTAFYVITVVGHSLGSQQISAYRGLAKRSPFIAAVFFVALFSLAGIPPLAGFFGKFMILMNAVRADLGALAFLGLLAVAVSLYYYLNIIRAMYFEEPTSNEPVSLSVGSAWTLLFLTLGIVLIGLWQAPFFFAARGAALSLF